MAYDDEAAKEKLEAAEWKSLTDTLANWNFGVGHCKLNRGEKTDDRRLPGH